MMKNNTGPNFYRRDIACAFFELLLQISIGILGITKDRGRLNPYLFVGITFTLQVFVLMIIMRSTRINIKSGDKSKGLLDHICNDLECKLDTNIAQEKKTAAKQKISTLKSKKYFINFKGIQVGSDGKANFAIFVLMCNAVIYAALTLLIPILYYQNLISKVKFSSLMFVAVVSGVIIPILFRAAGAIGSRSTLQAIQSIDELSTYICNLGEDKMNACDESKPNKKNCFAKVIKHIKHNKIYYQELSMAGFEIAMSLLLLLGIFMNSTRSMNPWLFACLSCLGKIIILCCIMRVLDYSFASNDSLEDLVNKLSKGNNKNDHSNQNGQISSDSVLSSRDTLAPFSKKTGRSIQEKGKYIVGTFQALYIICSTTTGLLVQYEYIQSVKLHVALSVISFCLGSMTLIAFRLVMNINFRANIDSINGFIESAKISIFDLQSVDRVDKSSLKVS